MPKFQKCGKCGEQYVGFEEKKTDVNIACQILNDTHLDHYDCCYVVSGDSDLVPPLEIVKRNHPDKRTLVAYPPHRKSKELCKSTDGWFAISRQKLKNSQLPKKVITSHGRKLQRPARVGLNSCQERIFRVHTHDGITNPA